MKIFLTLFLLASSVASAQFSLDTYLPSACLSAAVEQAFPDDPGAKAIAVAAAGLKYNFLGTELFLGMNMDDGQAMVWYYLVYSPQLDSAVGVALVRMGGSCTIPPIDENLELIDASEISKNGIPNGYVEGADLVGKINGNTEYAKFHAANPDSLPTVAVLTVSDEDVLGFPAGTPGWVVSWVPPDGSASLPFFCFIHATTGQIVCFGEEAMSVNDEAARRAGYAINPNPASTSATLTVPSTMVGKHAAIEAVNLTGQRIALANGVVGMASLPLNTNSLSPGMWSIIITAEGTQHVIPFAVLH